MIAVYSRLAKPLIGFVVAFAVGFVCSVFAIPSPSPPVIIGALIVMSMTVGYMLVDRLMVRPAVHAKNCGGPSGQAIPSRLEAGTAESNGRQD